MAFRAATARLAASGSFWESASEWAIKASGYRRYGLRGDDLIMEEIDGVKEALARLPQSEIDQRYFRLKRAMNQSLKHRYLPPAEQTKPEEDIQYLQPLLKQIKKEKAERAAWDNPQ